MSNWFTSMFSGARAPTVASGGETIPVAPSITPTYYLDAHQITLIKQHRPSYEWGCNKVSGVPWYALAGIHFRESEFAKTNPIPGGPFQLDPGGSGQTLQDRIRDFVKQVCYKYGLPYGDIGTDFLTACVVAAHELKSKAIAPLLNAAGQIESAILADALWGYNGRSKYHTPDGAPDQAKKSWQYSPYVSNDPHRGTILRLRGTVPDASVEGGRRHIDIEDKRPGALIVVDELLTRRAELG